MYSNWEEKTMLIQSKLKWYLVDDVLNYLHNLRTYVIETPGKLSASYLPKLIDTRFTSINTTSFHMPASRNERFPSNEVYLCEAIGEWSILLDRLRLACNIMVNTNRLERKYPDFETPGQLENYVLSLIYEMLQGIEKEQDFITLYTFEKRHDIIWAPQFEPISSDHSSKEDI